MNETDFRRTARAWLEEGPTRMADRGVQDALDLVHATRQRRVRWPAPRLPFMTPVLRIAGSAAAVVALVAAVAAVGLHPSEPGSVVNTPSPAPTATPSAGPTPLPSLAGGSLLIPVREGSVPLTAGTYVAATPFPMKITLTLPDGWYGNVGGPYAVFLSRVRPTAEVDFVILNEVYSDPCHFDRGQNPLDGPGVDDLVAALASLPGMTVTPPVDVTVGGYRGKQVTMTAPAQADGCTPLPGAGFRIWQLPLGATNDMQPGDSQQVTVLDVNGTRVILDVSGLQNGTTTLIPEVQAIVDSIRIEPGS